MSVFILSVIVLVGAQIAISAAMLVMQLKLVGLARSIAVGLERASSQLANRVDDERAELSSLSAERHEQIVRLLSAQLELLNTRKQ